MKKIGIICILLCIGLIIIYKTDKLSNDKLLIENKEEIKSTGIQGLAIMLQNEKGGYDLSVADTWQVDDYEFNPNLSRCENGGKLSWNDGKITLKTNGSDKCYVYFDKIKPYHETCDDKTLACHIAKLTKETEKDKLIYHNGTNELDANDKSYRYSGAEYVVTPKAIEEGYDSIYDIINIHCDDREQFNSIHCRSGEKESFSLRYEQPTNKYATLKQALNKAIQEGYIQDGNMNNYVCLASDQKACTNKDDLFRVLGVFANNGNYQTKLISADIIDDGQLKADYTGNHYIYYTGSKDKRYFYIWDDFSNDWKNAILKEKLNTSYLEYLRTLNINIDNIIIDASWQVGGINNGSLLNKDLHKSEVLNNANSKTITAKIGLIYISDYTYSVDSTYWNEYANLSSIYRFWDNWMYIGVIEYTITPYINDENNKAYYFNYSGYGPATLGGAASIRPTFYLNSNVQYISGDGSIDNPFLIN